MQRPRILQAFTRTEYEKAHQFLATKVAFMMGRKFEEGDWAEVYCGAKNIPNVGWSNLNIDVVHDCIGVEHKMLRPPGDRPVRTVFGTRLMHPSATRSIRIVDGEPNEVMRTVLAQYADFIEQRREFVRQKCSEGEAELRTGWVLSYFDIPPASNPNIYHFRVQGEEFKPGYVRMWIPAATARELERLVGELSSEQLDIVIRRSRAAFKELRVTYNVHPEEARVITLARESYILLGDMFPNAVSDAHLIQLLIAEISQKISS